MLFVPAGGAQAVGPPGWIPAPWYLQRTVAPPEPTEQHLVCSHPGWTGPAPTSEPLAQQALGLGPGMAIQPGAQANSWRLSTPGVNSHPRLSMIPGGDYVSDSDGTIDCDGHGHGWCGRHHRSACPVPAAATGSPGGRRRRHACPVPRDTSVPCRRSRWCRRNGDGSHRRGSCSAAGASSPRVSITAHELGLRPGESPLPGRVPAPAARAVRWSVRVRSSRDASTPGAARSAPAGATGALSTRAPGSTPAAPRPARRPPGRTASPRPRRRRI